MLYNKKIIIYCRFQITHNQSHLKSAKSSFLQESKSSLLDFIQRYALIGTWEYDIKSDGLYWSNQTKQIHEVEDDFIPNVEIGISFYKVGYSRDTITKLFTNCIENHQSFDVELQIVTANGEDKWVRAIGKAIVKNKECVKVQGLFQDIDEKTKTAKILAQKEDQLRRTFDDALIGMAIVDLEGNWVHVNKSLCKTFGYTKEELKSKTFMDLTHPEDAKKGQKAIIDMLNGRINNFETEKRYINKNGDVIWSLLSASVVRDNNGKPLHFVAQINDLTSIKASTQKISQLLATTEKQNKRLLNFAHIVSHNLRSHYSNLDMLLDITRMDHPESTDNQIFPLVEKAVGQLGETVENLNEVAVINIQNELEIESINLLKSITKVYDSISALILKSKTEVIINVGAHLNIKGFTAYLDSIILNFITNAIKYKKPLEHAKIELNAHIKNEFIILEVKDYGLGIDLNRHGKKLFGMYKTFHNHKDSRGLGLFITKNQVEALGGKIEVKSEVNKGTSFYIYFKTA